ncbi:MAG: Holliday junction branch migration DNA helicase RuvB [Lentisphaerae bacterium]|nr:Holliday junction branch migration DNA helicase RuvB [Lentisphaerota bacterium]
MKERLISDTLNKKELDFEATLRPVRFDDFIGQDKVKERLELFVTAARERGEALDHVLLLGPPGLGKTTLAHILANAMDVPIKSTSGPVLMKPGDLVGLLSSIEKNQILFIDEIHRLNRAVEEYLYGAMEDFVIDIMLDQGPHSKSIRLNLPKFTLVSATTRSGLLSAPLRSRFGMTSRLDYYHADDLCKIVKRTAGILNVAIDSEGALEIARRSRGTPRITNKLLRWTRDYAQVRANNRINKEVADSALSMLDIDKNGLDEMDKRILDTIINKFSGGPVGINSIAVSVSEESDTIEEVYEPFLIQEGYLRRTPQGRMATDLGYAVLGLASNRDTSEDSQKTLF